MERFFFFWLFTYWGCVTHTSRCSLHLQVSITSFQLPLKLLEQTEFVALEFLISGWTGKGDAVCFNWYYTKRTTFEPSLAKVCQSAQDFCGCSFEGEGDKQTFRHSRLFARESSWLQGISRMRWGWGSGWKGDRPLFWSQSIWMAFMHGPFFKLPDWRCLWLNITENSTFPKFNTADQSYIAELGKKKKKSGV